MKRALLLSVLVLLVMALAPVASAGEVKGPPGPDGATGGFTPIGGGGFWAGEAAASICSFSGLNDVIITDPTSEDFEPTQTQSYGTFLVLVKNFLGVSAQEAMAILEEHPGGACNPTTGPNPKGVGS